LCQFACDRIEVGGCRKWSVVLAQNGEIEKANGKENLECCSKKKS